MQIKEVNIKEGSIFITDVHYKKGDKDFLEVLQNWLHNPPSQVFFLGDIFHLLLDFKFLVDYNKEAIDLVNKLSLKTEVYYTYGNHDFNINKVFKNVIFADAFVDKKKSIFITHGDLNNKDLFYKIYSKIIRNEFFLNVVNLLTLNIVHNFLFKKILKKNVKCSTIKKFKTFIKEKISNIDYKNIIEGHFHQNVNFDFNEKIYINLGAFKCIKSFYIYEDFTIKEIHGNGQNIKSRLKRT